MPALPKLLIRIFISLSCFVFVAYLADPNELLLVTKKIDITVLIIAMLLMILGHIGSGLRFQYVLKSMGRKLSYSEAIKVSFVALWFNQLLPTGMGGDVVRGLLLAKKCGRLRIILAALLDRVFGFLWMVIIVLFSVPLFLRDRLDFNTTIIIVVTSIFVVLLGLMPLFFHKNSCYKSSKIALIRICKLIVLYGRSINKVLVGDSIMRLLLYLALAFFPYIFYVSMIGQSFNLDIKLYEYIAIVPIIFISMQIPISIGGWGVRELASVYVFSNLGVSVELALLISVLYGIGLLLTSVPGNIFWVFHKR